MMVAKASEVGPESVPAWVRTTATFLLIVHLFFALFVAVLCNPPASSFLMRLNRLGHPYLQPIFLDTNYRFALTNGDYIDGGWELTTRVTLKNGEVIQQSTVPEDMWPSIRRQRYFRLGETLAENDSDMIGPDGDTIQAHLAKGLANGFVHELEAQGIARTEIESMVLELTFRGLLDPQAVLEGTDPQSPQLRELVYSADIIPLADDILVNKRTAAGEAAPGVEAETEE